MKTHQGHLPQTLRHFLIGVSLACLAAHYLEAVAQTNISNELGWQPDSGNLYFTTSGTVSIGDNARGDDSDGTLVINNSNNNTPSLLLHFTSGSSTTRLHVKANPATPGDWEIATINDGTSPLVTRLRIGGTGTSTTVEMRGGSNGQDVYSTISTSGVLVNGILSATSLSGDGSGLTNISVSQLKDPNSLFTATSAIFATSAARLANPVTITLTGDVSGSPCVRIVVASI